MNGRSGDGRDSDDSDWDRITAAVKEGFARGVNLWLDHSMVNGGTVQGPDATLTPGCLSGAYPIEAEILQAALEAEASSGQARQLGKELSDAWKAWAQDFTLRMPGSYPTLAAFPGPAAPPTPGARMIPVREGRSAGEVNLKGKRLEFMLMGALSGTEDRDRRALQQGIEGLAQWVERAFREWKSHAFLDTTQVLAMGPVPNFAPPFVPMGPVVSGRLLTRGTGVFRGIPFGQLIP